uniref:U6 snRNA-associated Sm-like protein LSm1 n=1 Tax=Oncorhynchus mykiss TaxID=8022 RepID=A0A8K9Y4H1_ONCMY
IQLQLYCKPLLVTIYSPNSVLGTTIGYFVSACCRSTINSNFPLAEKHLVLLRDGRTLIGFLRSIDQFANLVFHQTVERIHVGKKFGDIPRGIFIVRGENVVLLGEIDMDKPCDTVLQQVSIEEILEEQRLQQQAKQETEKAKVTALKDRGLSIPKADNLDEY